MNASEYTATLLTLRALIDLALENAGAHATPAPERASMETLYGNAQAAICRTRQNGLSSARISAVIGEHPEWRWAWPSGNSIGYLRSGSNTHGIKSGEKVELIARALNEYCDVLEAKL